MPVLSPPGLADLTQKAPADERYDLDSINADVQELDPGDSFVEEAYAEHRDAKPSALEDEFGAESERPAYDANVAEELGGDYDFAEDDDDDLDEKPDELEVDEPELDLGGDDDEQGDLDDEA